MTPWWSDHHQGRSDCQPMFKSGLTTSLCIAHGLAATRVGQTASTSNSQIWNLKVVVAIVTVWPQIELRSDRQVRKNYPPASLWSVGYKYPSISCKISLLVIWIAYLTLESPLSLSHTSPYRSIVSVWGSSAWFELCGTSDSSSKRHRLVTLSVVASQTAWRRGNRELW
jgi:hypothetical protein